MPDSAELRKPLHPFAKLVAIVTVIIATLDVTLVILTKDKMVGLQLDAQARLWISDVGQILLQVAYLTGLAVIVELIDRILWRLTPEAERRVRRSRRPA